MECQYVATQRGGIALVFEGHRYNKVRDGKDGTVYWRCSRDRQCPGRAVTVNNRVKKANNKHNHPAESGGLLGGGGGGGGGGGLRNGTAATPTATTHYTTSGSSSTGLSPTGSTLSTNALTDCSGPTSQPSAPRLPSSLALQDVFNAQTAAAAAAVSFPAIVTETLKYLAYASGNHQMASFASSMANFGCPSLENIERSICRGIFTNEGLTISLSLFLIN